VTAVVAGLLLVAGCRGGESETIGTPTVSPPTTTGGPAAPAASPATAVVTEGRERWRTIDPGAYRFRYFRAAGDWWSVNWDVWVWEDRVVPVLVTATPTMGSAEVKDRMPDGGVDWVWAETLDAVQPGGNGMCSAASSTVEVDDVWGVPELVWCDDPALAGDGEGWGVIEVTPLDVPAPADVEVTTSPDPFVRGLPGVDAIVTAAAELGSNQPGRRVVSDGAGIWVTPIVVAADGVWFQRPGSPPIGNRIEVLDGRADYPPRLAGAQADEIVVFLHRANDEAGVSWEVLWWATRSGNALRVVDPDGWRLDLEPTLLCPGSESRAAVELVAAWAGELAETGPGDESSMANSEEALAGACTQVAGSADPGDDATP